jgi:hypothetical protein
MHLCIIAVIFFYIYMYKYKTMNFVYSFICNTIKMEKFENNTLLNLLYKLFHRTLLSYNITLYLKKQIHGNRFIFVFMETMILRKVKTSVPSWNLPIQHFNFQHADGKITIWRSGVSILYTNDPPTDSSISDSYITTRTISGSPITILQPKASTTIRLTNI